MNKRRETISILLALVLLVLALLAAGCVLMPDVYQTGINWSSYRREERNSVDVFFVGSSVTFCGVSPAMVYAENGMTAFNVAGPEQTIPISYYYIRQACRTQTPKAVFLELSGMFFTRYEEHSASNIAFMPMGRERFAAMLNCAGREDIPGLILPVLDYHSRWHSFAFSELGDKLFPTPDVTAGFVKSVGENADPEIKTVEKNTEYYDYSLQYLKKIAELCAQRGIALYLYSSPVTTRVAPEQSERLERDIAALPVAGYMDFNDEQEWARLGLDPVGDFFDALHLNVSGAQKLSSAIAERLTADGFSPTVGEDEELWQRRIEFVCS